MSDVFISYARSSEPQAQAIASALREHGFSVWREGADREAVRTAGLLYEGIGRGLPDAPMGRRKEDS